MEFVDNVGNFHLFFLVVIEAEGRLGLESKQAPSINAYAQIR